MLTCVFNDSDRSFVYENLLYFQPLESQPGCLKVLAKALPQKLGVGVSILSGAVLGAASGACLHWGLTSYSAMTQVWVRQAPAMEGSFSGSAEFVCSRWGGPPLQWPGLQGRNGCVAQNKAEVNLQPSLPNLQYRLCVKQQPPLTSALMSHLEFHVLNGDVIYFSFPTSGLLELPCLLWYALIEGIGPWIMHQLPL